MKRGFSLLVITLFALVSLAQTQQGVVKTRGKMVNGKLVPGVGLSGATVTIQGRNAVKSQNNGTFSFPIPSKTFMLLSAQKQGYQLVDADATRKAYQYSPNTFYIVMETPEQQAEDKLAAERKIRRTLQKQLEQREEELEQLKAQNKLTQEEYRKAMQQLFDDQKNNEKLIANMAQEYAAMDYDQMDELNRQISDAILNGELTRADSLLRSKGDMKSRDAEITRRQEAEAQRESEIAKEQDELAASKEGTRKLLEDYAEDCYNYFKMYKLENKHDSAAYYIELRANRDTTNADWQFHAGYYLKDQNQFRKAQVYYERALRLYQRLAATNSESYEPDLATTQNNLANLYSDTQRFSESEEMYKEALEICRRLAQQNPQAYEPDVAMTLNNLAALYSDTQRFSESEEMYKEALEIYCRLAQQNPESYEPDVAMTLNNLALLFSATKRFEEAEEMYKEALAICRRLAQQNPQAHEHDVASILYSTGLLKVNQEQYADAIPSFEEALEIYRRVAKVNPAQQQWYSSALYYLSQLYSATNNTLKAYQINQEWIPILKMMYEARTEELRGEYASKLGSQSWYAIFMKQYVESEQLAHEGLQVDSTQHWIATNLAAALLFQGKYDEAEAIYRQYKNELKDSFLDDFKQFAEAGVIPPEYEADVEKIKRMLEEE